MRLIALLAAFLAMTGPGVGASLAAEPPKEIAKCQDCHGVDGNSSSGEVPRLNGQSWSYIANRVRSFRDVTKQSAHATQFMLTVNSSVNDAALLDLAHYFAGQPPAVAAPAGALAEKGRALYQKGDGKAVPACQTCHGAAG